MTEHQAQKFYLHDRYIATYYAMYIEIEKFLSSLVFRNDISRVFLASNDYAYRRRFELTDTSQEFADLSLASLRFPFANYNPLQSSWMPDDRANSNNASLLFSGVAAQSRNLRAMAVQLEMPVTFHFDREDDARLAYEMLMYTAYTPQFLETKVAWQDETIAIPVNIQLKNLTFNAAFTEQSWLQENRVFPITALYTLRSYMFLPDKQPNFSANTFTEDNERFLLTEEVILKFYESKGLSQLLSIDSLFNQNPEIMVEYFSVLSTTATTARLGWAVTGSPLTSIQLFLQGKETVTLSPDRLEYQFRGLKGGSTYIVRILFTAENGKSKQVVLQFTTPLSASQAKAQEAPKNTLVGTSW